MELPAFPWLEPAASATVRIQTVFLHVTKACDLRCAYCYFSAATALPDELTTDELGRLWPDLVALRPRKVVFTGGEPLLRPDLLELLRGLRAADPEHVVTRCLNSNGRPVTSDVALALVGLADEVRVSIDALEERNDRLRGRGAFAAALRALEVYRSVGFEPKALVTVTSESLPDLEELLCLLFARDIEHVNLNPFRPVGRGAEHLSWAVDLVAVAAVIDRVWRRCRGRPAPEAPRLPVEPVHCGAGRFLNVLPNGDVYPCHVLTQPEFRCGNLRELGLLEICRRRGLLGELDALDFHAAARAEPAAEPLARGACLGEVFAGLRTSPVWRDVLPSLGPAGSRP